MDAPYEIVHVISATRLIDSESYQRTIEPEQAGRLKPGFFLVVWTSRESGLRFDRSARFFGPFATRHAAEQAQAKWSSAGLSMPADPSSIEMSNEA